MSIVMALVGSALSVGSFWLLVSNAAGACSGFIGMISCAGVVVCSLAGAKGWYDLLAGKFPSKKN